MADTVKNRTLAVALAAKTADAYSADRYLNWTAVCAMLVRSGYTEQQAEAILRSKHMRWAADASTLPYGRVSVRTVEQYIAKQGKTWAREVDTLTAETFPAGVEA